MEVSRLIHPRDLLRGDILVYHPDSRKFEIWRGNDRRQKRIAGKELPVEISNRRRFLEVVREAGSLATPSLTSTQEVRNFLVGTWAYKLV